MQIREAEKIGRVVNLGGTKQTKAKRKEPLIGRLIDNKKIGSEEMRAIQEIELVYGKICSGLFMKASSLDRIDGGRSGDRAILIDAYWRRYKPWADFWSSRKKRYGDATLEIVFDLLFSSVTAREIDAVRGFRKGTSIAIFVSGLRDYAAHAGWVDAGTAGRWKADARRFFPVRRMRARSA